MAKTAVIKPSRLWKDRNTRNERKTMKTPAFPIRLGTIDYLMRLANDNVPTRQLTEQKREY